MPVYNGLGQNITDVSSQTDPSFITPSPIYSESMAKIVWAND